MEDEGVVGDRKKWYWMSASRLKGVLEELEPSAFQEGADRGELTRIFYACDIHGSELTYCWKFLNAAKFYEVDALASGGDLMGKLLIPIVREADWYLSRQVAGVRTITSGGDEEMERFKRTLQTLGFYWQ